MSISIGDPSCVFVFFVLVAGESLAGLAEEPQLVGSSYIVSEQISREDADNRLGGLEDFRAELEMLTKEWCVPCRCGMPNRNKTRIVGGVETVAHEFPWMAELQIRGRFFCGGALINDRYILTAGHCLRGDFNLQELTVVLGEHDRNDPKDSKVLVKSVSEVIIHPKYDPTTPKMHDNDLALLKLSSPVMLNSNIKPVCLPPQAIVDTNMLCVPISAHYIYDSLKAFYVRK